MIKLILNPCGFLIARFYCPVDVFLKLFLKIVYKVQKKDLFFSQRRKDLALEEIVLTKTDKNGSFEYLF
jgi:ABC-type molybdate transport system substrate-binding protein